MDEWVIAIHGGCGVMPETPDREADYEAARQDLAQALRAGLGVLRQGGRALDAVEAAVVVLEDSPHFNAGHGAALNAAGEHELDASIMDGGSRAAGAVAAVRRIRNPVRAARAVLDSGSLALLVGDAADAYAQARGLAIVEPSYFTTHRRELALGAMKAHAAAGTLDQASEAEKHGTVGAVARDGFGHLAAATSTGGFTDKAPGRVGDSPIIGAGTYARDRVCAVSGTGQGEYFIRHVAAHEVASRMAYLGQSLSVATEGVIADFAPYAIGAGMIALDARGQVAAPYNTPGMCRGWAALSGEIVVATHATLYRLAG